MVLSSLNPCCSGRWSRTHSCSAWHCQEVLILVVVDDGLVHVWRNSAVECAGVLILVVVDDGLVHRQEGGMGYIPGEVLILVVVDDGLVPRRSTCIGKLLSRS